jgi:urea transport system ATP-binding protein
MSPELMEQGAERLQQAMDSGGRAPSYGRLLREGELDLSHGTVLYLDDISVSFDGFKALNKLSLDIAAGELRCIIGPNGAGKTTMMDVITGKTRPDAGQAFFGNTINLLRHRESEIVRLGIGRKFQKPTVFEQLTVLQNLELSLQADPSVWACLRFRPSGAQRECMDAVLAQIHLKAEAQRQAGLLSHGQKQWLEIGMLLMLEPKLLLLDEPVAGMTDFETERTAELLLGLQGSHSLMVVEHDMKFIAALTADDAKKKVTVLHEGRVLAEGSLAHVQDDPQVLEVYLGR